MNSLDRIKNKQFKFLYDIIIFFEICQKMKKNDKDNYMTNQTFNHDKDTYFPFLYQRNLKSLVKEN